MLTKHKKEKAERKLFREMLARAYDKPESDPDFTRRVMREARHTRPAPLVVRICGKITEFFCSPILIFIAVGIGIFILRDKIVTATANLCNGQFLGLTQGVQSLLVLGCLFALIVFACKEMIRESEH